MELRPSSIQPYVVCGCVVVVALVMLAMYQARKRRRRISVEGLQGWKSAGRVEKLWIYPIKSCKGIRVDYFDCTKLGPVRGPLRDRVFMFVDEAGKFITGRRYPKLVLIESIVTEDRILLRAPGMEDLSVEIPQRVQKEASVLIAVHLAEEPEASPQLAPTNAVDWLRQNLSLVRATFLLLPEVHWRVLKIWGEIVKAIDCGDSVSDWITELLSSDGTEGSRFRMVYHARTSTMREQKEYEFWPLMFKEDGAAFTNLTPYLLINEDSVNDLCSKLENPDLISAMNFRPNILVEDAGAFSEDKWAFVKVGDVVFRQMKPCERCILTTVNPDKGEKDRNQEPLRTLRKYRCASDPKVKAIFGISPIMGINLAAEKTGRIREGDSIEYIESRHPKDHEFGFTLHK